MKRYAYLDTRAGKLIFAFFLAFQLYLSRDTLVSSSLVGFTRSQLLLALSAGILGIGFLAACRGELWDILRDRRVAAIAAAAAIFLLPCLIKRDWQLMYGSMLFCVVLALFLTYFRSVQEVSRVYVALLTALGIYSILATYLLRRLADGGAVAVPVLYNSQDVKFYNFLLTFVSESYVKNRNFGIFREPGVYQFFLLLALYLNNEWASWENRRVTWAVNAALAAAMVTTLATGGMLELIALAAFLFFDRRLYRNRAALIAAAGLVLAAAAFLAWVIAEQGTLYWELYGMTVSKFLPGEESAVDRMLAFRADVELFLSAPLLGAPLAEVLHAVENNTSSTLILYAALGVAGGSLNVAGWIALVWRRERNLFGNLVLLGILAMSFNTENLTADVFFWLFPMMALAERLLSQRKDREAENGAN